MQPQCLILGGGASGLAAAVCLARANVPALLLEGQSRVGKKLLSTGNGRCNYSNVDLNPQHYGAATDFVAALWQAVPPEEVAAFWAELGLLSMQEEGRLYPRTSSATSVLDALRLPLEGSSVTVVTDAMLTALEHKDGSFIAVTKNGRRFAAPRMLCCLGGSAAPKLGTDGAGVRLLQGLGHSVRPQVPALVQLRCAHPALPSLKGLRVHAAPGLTIDSEEVAREEGELLFTEYGLSGVCVMQLSGDAAAALQAGRAVEIRVDLLPEVPRRALFGWLKARFAQFPERSLADCFTGVFPRMLTRAIVKEARLSPETPADALSPEDIRALTSAIGAFPIPVTGTRGFEAAQVTRGGIRLDEVDPATLASRLVPGLFIAGETLDVDGPCGGYNLHFAFTSGIAAAHAVLQAVAP